jgi:hypothetical protein
MIGASARGITRGDSESAASAPVVARWLYLAAAPTFAVMALSTIVLDSGPPNALCGGAGGSALTGMAPMYLLMALFHLAPWLKLMSRQHS